MIEKLSNVKSHNAHFEALHPCIASLPNTTTHVLAKQLSTTLLLSYMFHTAVPASTISL
jgi:hypothetical protein